MTRSCIFRLDTSCKWWKKGEDVAIAIKLRIFGLAYLHLTLTYSEDQGHVWAFELYIFLWHWHILKVNCKVTYISTGNILEMITDRENITNASNRKTCIVFPLLCIHLTLIRYKRQDQGRAYIDANIIQIVKDREILRSP